MIDVKDWYGWMALGLGLGLIWETRQTTSHDTIFPFCGTNCLYLLGTMYLNHHYYEPTFSTFTHNLDAITVQTVSSRVHNIFKDSLSLHRAWIVQTIILLFMLRVVFRRLLLANPQQHAQRQDTPLLPPTSDSEISSLGGEWSVSIPQIGNGYFTV